MANNPIRCAPSSQTDEKLIDRNRRKEMEDLFSTLNSLVPHQSSTEARTMVDELEDATNYIKELQKNIEKLKEKNEKLIMGKNKKMVEKDRRRKSKPKLLEHVKAHEVGSSVQIFLTTGSDYHSIIHQILILLQDNGAETVNVNQTRVKDRVFHRITAQVDGEGMAPKDGKKICEIVKNFVSEYKDGDAL